MTVSQAARRIGVEPTHLRRWERGERTLRADRLWDLLSGLGLDFGDFQRALEERKETRSVSTRLSELLEELKRLR